MLQNFPDCSDCLTSVFSKKVSCLSFSFLALKINKLYKLCSLWLRRPITGLEIDPPGPLCLALLALIDVTGDAGHSVASFYNKHWWGTLHLKSTGFRRSERPARRSGRRSSFIKFFYCFVRSPGLCPVEMWPAVMALSLMAECNDVRLAEWPCPLPIFHGH